MTEENAQTTTEFMDSRLFTLTFGKDGQGGAVGALKHDLKGYGKKVTKLDEAIRGFDQKFEIYNGLHQEHKNLTGVVSEHLERCKEIQQAKETTKQIAKETAEAYLKGVSEAEKKGAAETKETIKYTVNIIVAVLGALSTSIGIITYFLGYWRF